MGKEEDEGGGRGSRGFPRDMDSSPYLLFALFWLGFGHGAVFGEVVLV